MIATAHNSSSVRAPLILLSLQFLLIVLAISRYDSVSLYFRGTDQIDLFNWFWRYRIADTVCFFDVLVVGILGLVLYQVWISGRLRRSSFDGLALGLSALILFSIGVKALSQGPGDTLKDFLFAVRNYFYFLTIYLAASRMRWSEERYLKSMRILIGLVVLIILLSIWEMSQTPPEYILSKYGRLVSLRDVEDFLPIMFAQFWMIILCCESFPLKLWQRGVIASCLLYSMLVIFTGTGKGPLIVYPLFLGYISWYYKLYRYRWFHALVALIALGVVLLVGMVIRGGIQDPSSPLYVYTTFNSEDISVLTRAVEIVNFGDNLIERKALVQGIGLGNKWYEYIPQPPDGGAFPKEEQGSSWHLGIHVALLRMALDFGLVGMGILLIMFFRCFVRTYRLLRAQRWNPITNAFIQASWLAIAFQIIMNSLSIPKSNLIVGFLFGAISGLLDADNGRPTLDPTVPEASDET